MISRLEQFSTMKVLVVDDERANVDLLLALLLGQGLQCVTGETDSRRVPTLLPVVNPDLVLLDLQMPNVDGHEVLEEITKFAGDTYLPVLVLTADVTTKARDRALTNGARDFLTKPFDLAEVTLRVANLLESRHLYGALRRAFMFEDRDRISRHLHGTVLGRLFTVEKSLRTVADLIPTTDAKSQLKEAIMEIDRTVRQIRTTVHELGSAEIDRNVRSQVLALVRALDPMVGFRVEVSFVGPVDSAIPIVLTEHLLATTREALTNIGRHARATAATIILSFEDGLCRLDITDNGQGMGDAANEIKGNGLASLRRRAEKLQGQFTVEAPGSGGTLLIWQVPITERTIDLARRSSIVWDYFL